jgi:glycosyltransferase involved in cell wall biosynthesis
MTRFPNARALWVGGGEVAPEIGARIATSAHASRHVREPWTNDMVGCFAAMDVLAFPPIRRESFGRVSAEAQACGLPVVASRVGGIPETLRENVSGLLVAPGDVPAWIESLASLIGDPDRRVQMGAAGRAQARERFSSVRIAAEFGKILESQNGPLRAREHQPATIEDRRAPDTRA